MIVVRFSLKPVHVPALDELAQDGRQFGSRFASQTQGDARQRVGYVLKMKISSKVKAELSRRDYSRRRARRVVFFQDAALDFGNQSINY